jgi:Tol biopolymer transport system component
VPALPRPSNAHRSDSRRSPRRLLRLAFASALVAIVLLPGAAGGARARYDDVNADWSPDGHSIVFGRPGQAVLILDVATGSERELMAWPDANVWPRPQWSPDGRTILVDSCCDAKTIVVVPAAGGTPRVLAAGRAATWSPDGSRIAYVDAAGRLAIMNADGTGQHAIAGAVENPAWSPDGTRIVAVAGQVLETLRTDGTDVAAVSPIEYSAGSPAPSWSPTGEWIAFTSGDSTEIVHPDSSALRRLGADVDPGTSTLAWSPDGARLAFSSADDCGAGQTHYGISVAAPNGTARLRLTQRCEIVGTAGPDNLVGTPGNDVILGLAGDDRIAALADIDTVHGGPGNDTIDGGPGPADKTVCDDPESACDWLYGDAGDDTLHAGDDSTYENGGAGDDVLAGGAGADWLVGGDGHDVLAGNGGNDVIRARDGHSDRVSCGPGYDRAIVDRFDEVAADCEDVQPARPGRKRGTTQIAYLAELGGLNTVDGIDPDGTHRRRFLPRNGFNRGLAFSADGATLALARSRGADTGTLELALLRTREGSLRQLTRGPNGAVAPAWSPNGRALAFIRVGPHATSWLALVGADGREERRLAATRYADSSSLVAGYVPAPSWSPTGEAIAYASAGDVFVIDLRSGKARNLTRSPGLDAAPAWSSDGTTIAWVRGRRIWLMRPDGSAKRPVGRVPGVSEGAPAWSPTPRRERLLFSVYAAPNALEASLYVAGAPFTRPRRVSGPHQEGVDAAWSPDGNRIVAATFPGIWVMNADGSHRRRVAPGGEDPAWGRVPRGR